MSRPADSDRDPFVSATEIAALFFCENKIVLDRRLGETVTERQAKARSRGVAEHERADQAGRQLHNQPETGPKGPCFIATHVYGSNDPRTNQLRCFRDQSLKQSAPGRLAVLVYYRYSPLLVIWLQGRPLATRTARFLVDLVRILVAPRIGG